MPPTSAPYRGRAIETQVRVAPNVQVIAVVLPELEAFAYDAATWISVNCVFFSCVWLAPTVRVVSGELQYITASRTTSPGTVVGLFETDVPPPPAVFAVLYPATPVSERARNDPFPWFVHGFSCFYYRIASGMTVKDWFCLSRRT